MNRIIDLRKEAKKSMAQVARELSMPYTTYVNYEKGYRELNSETLLQFANYFNVSVDYLIGRSNNKSLVDQQTNQFENNNIIQSKRIELGISVKEFADAVGVSETLVNQWEKDMVTPAYNDMVKISKFLNISITDLLPQETSVKVADVCLHTKDEITLFNNYKALNNLGKEKLIDYSDDLVSNGKYTEK